MYKLTILLMTLLVTGSVANSVYASESAFFLRELKDRCFVYTMAELPKSGTAQQIFEAGKKSGYWNEGDFIKLRVGEKVIFVYNSAVTDADKNKIYEFNKLNYTELVELVRMPN